MNFVISRNVMDKKKVGKARTLVNVRIDGLLQEDFADMLRRKGDLHERRCLEAAIKKHFGDGVLKFLNVMKQDTKYGGWFYTFSRR